MGSVVQKEAWVGPLDWADDQIKVVDNDDDNHHDSDDLPDLSTLTMMRMILMIIKIRLVHTGKKYVDNDNENIDA